MSRFRDIEPDDEALSILRSSRLLAEIDEEAWAASREHLRWIEVDAGEDLFEEGEPGDGIYFLVRGRVEAISVGPRGEAISLRWVLPGEPIGELATFGDWPRSATARVARRAQLAFLSRESFERWVDAHPSFLLALSRLIVQRLRSTSAQAVASQGGRPERRQVRSLFVMPLCRPERCAAFADALTAALSSYGSVARIEREEALLEGVALTDRVDRVARQHRWVLLLGEPYEGSSGGVAWNEACRPLADLLLFVTAADEIPPIAAVEAVRAPSGPSGLSQRREAVLLQPPGTTRPLATGGVLDMLPCQLHHHVRRGDRSELSRADVARVARFAADEAVALVLGGGAARGAAHVGVMQALEELGVEVDLYCGTSIGSIVAGLGAMEKSSAEIRAILRRELITLRLLEPTLPIRSGLSGRGMRRAIARIFGGLHIEDLWRPMMAVASSLHRAEPVTFRRGPVAEATRISGSVPGLFPPVARDGDLLADGMMMSNVPVEEVRRLAGCRIIAVNLMPVVDPAFAAPEAPTSPRGILSWLRSLYTTNVMEITLRSFVLGTSRQAGELAHSVDCYIEPAVGRFAFFNVLALDAMERLGYEAALEALREWKGREREERRP